jgi:hypothetical protein
LKHHQVLVEKQATLIEFQDARRARQVAVDALKIQRDQQRSIQMTYLFTWLVADDLSSDDQARGEAAREEDPTSGKWLFRRGAFKDWFDLQSKDNPILWIHGKPGAGKRRLNLACVS